MPSELTFYSRVSSHSFTVNAELNDTTNCSSFRIFGLLPVESDNSAKYRVCPAPEITISYIPYDDGESSGGKGKGKGKDDDDDD